MSLILCLFIVHLLYFLAANHPPAFRHQVMRKKKKIKSLVGEGVGPPVWGWSLCRVVWGWIWRFYRPGEGLLWRVASESRKSEIHAPTMHAPTL